MAELDDLWVNRSGGAGWITTAADDQRAWCEEIAARMVEVGRPPVWAAVHRKFKEKWPNDPLPSSTTLADNIRKLAEQRG